MTNEGRLSLEINAPLLNTTTFGNNFTIKGVTQPKVLNNDKKIYCAFDADNDFTNGV